MEAGRAVSCESLHCLLLAGGIPSPVTISLSNLTLFSIQKLSSSIFAKLHDETALLILIKQDAEQKILLQNQDSVNSGLISKVLISIGPGYCCFSLHPCYERGSRGDSKGLQSILQLEVV